MIDKLRNFGPVMWIAANWQIVLALAGAFALWSTALYWIGRDHGYDARMAQEAKARVRADKLEDESAAKAAQDREGDAAGIAANKESRNAAITGAGETDRAPSASRIAGNCERMRQAGTDVSQLPACRGREAGSEAHTGD